jgi:hypothetical protein
MRILLSALVAVAAFAGPTQTRPVVKPVPQKAQAAAAKPRLSDQQLEAAIRKKFEKSKIAANGFQVQVHSGIAVITGRTGIIQHKGTATRLAKNAGARSVENRVEVDKAARDRAAARLHQKPRAVTVKRTGARSEN